MAEWLARFRGESVPHTPPQLKAATSMQTFTGSAPPKWAKTAENDLTQIPAPASAGGKSKTMAEWLARFRGESVTPPKLEYLASNDWLEDIRRISRMSFKKKTSLVSLSRGKGKRTGKGRHRGHGVSPAAADWLARFHDSTPLEEQPVTVPPTEDAVNWGRLVDIVGSKKKVLDLVDDDGRISQGKGSEAAEISDNTDELTPLEPKELFDRHLAHRSPKVVQI